MAVAKPWNCALRKLKLDLSLPRRSRANRWQVEDTTPGVVGTPPGGRGLGWSSDKANQAPSHSERTTQGSRTLQGDLVKSPGP